MMKQEWLSILCTLAVCIAVSHMTDCHLAGEFCQVALIEDLCDNTLTLDTMKNTISVYCYNTAALLSSVLKGVQTIICKACSVLYTIDSKHTTFVVKLVVSVFVTITHFAVRFYLSILYHQHLGAPAPRHSVARRTKRDGMPLGAVSAADWGLDYGSLL
jgi:hypothetical protein